MKEGSYLGVVERRNFSVSGEGLGWALNRKERTSRVGEQWRAKVCQPHAGEGHVTALRGSGDLDLMAKRAMCPAFTALKSPHISLTKDASNWERAANKSTEFYIGL